MKAKQFVDYLNSLIPSSTNGMAKEILKKMKIEPQAHPTSYNDELSALINNYEMDGIEIGMISFLGLYKITDDHYIFGNIEMDFIGFDKNTREIVLLDHDEIAFVMMKCAKDSISFLKVLKRYSEYTIRRLLNEEVTAINSSLIYSEAGGLEYKSFIDLLFYPAIG